MRQAEACPLDPAQWETVDSIGPYSKCMVVAQFTIKNKKEIYL